MNIFVKDPLDGQNEGAAMNRDEGQHHLSHVFDDLLVDKTSRNAQTALILLLSSIIIQV